MFDFDNFREIFSTMKKNKMRTFLTGFSIAWGILILIILLGAGNGLKNGILYNFRNMANNNISIYPSYTSKPYKGLASNRKIELEDHLIPILKKLNPEITNITATVSTQLNLSYQTQSENLEIVGSYPSQLSIVGSEIKANMGRFINYRDIELLKKVIVISHRTKNSLFKDQNPIGKYINLNGLPYKVIGVYEASGAFSSLPAYIPFSTAQTLYFAGHGLHSMNIVANNLVTQKQNEEFNKKLRKQLAALLSFDPEDTRAIYLDNSAEYFMMLNKIMKGINLLLWAIGLGSLMAGIVGISNIMLVTVRERTREIGIRKAIGAKPTSILLMITLEAIIITTIFGYLGMIIGIGITEIANTITENIMANQSMANDGTDGLKAVSIFMNPTVDLGTAFMATIVLILAGVFAGYFPARKATRISAIDAIRNDL